MNAQAPVDTPLRDLLDLVRCPYCMSRLISLTSSSGGEEEPFMIRQGDSPLPRHGEPVGLSTPQSRETNPHGVEVRAALHCSGCDRSYPLQQVGPGSINIPWLMRDDALATLDQDIVVSRSDPDSTRLDYRRHIKQVERRERFLAPFVSHTANRYIVPSVKGPPSTRENDLLNRFVRGLPSDGVALTLGCDVRVVIRLTRLGLRVVGVDTSRARLERAMAAAATASVEASAEIGARMLFVGADPMEAPFAAASVDGVWCDGPFASVRPDRRTVFFRQVNRILRPGGLLCLGAVTEPSRVTLRRYLLQRYVYRWPVVYGDDIERSPRGETGGWRYRAVTSARAAHTLCHEHGFEILMLRRADSSLLLLARKERGTDG